MGSRRFSLIGRLLRTVVVVAAGVTVAGGCSASVDTTTIAPVEASIPGVIYLSTSAGEVQRISPETGSVETVLAAGDAPVAELAAVANATELHAIVVDPNQSFATDLSRVDAGGLSSITVDAGEGQISCIDPHAGATTPVAHVLSRGTELGSVVNPGAQPGSTFTAIAYESGDDVGASLDLTSTGCPRWTSDRTTVATSIRVTPNIASSITTVVQTTAGARWEIGDEGCGVSPTSISPDDAVLVLNLTCYSNDWERSGLYLVSLDDMTNTGEVGALTPLAAGLYGRSSWHPDGRWIAAGRAEPIPGQTIATDLSTQPVGLQLIEVSAGRVVDLEPDGEADAFSPAWLEKPIT